MRIWIPGLRARAEVSLRLRDAWRLSPPMILAISLLVFMLLGALLLWLPIASADGQSMGVWKALFTASAMVTVTGLSILDGGSLSLFGETVVLVLIHLGGLGLMTFAALTVMALGGRLGLRGQRLVREAMNQTSPGDVLTLVRYVVILAVSVEVVGALVLALVWVPEMGWWRGLWFSLFHAVSAFNNAGVALLPESLAPWASSPLVNGVITALFITGGLGFTVLLDLWRQRNFSRLSLHSKLTLSGTLVLALGAWLLVMLFEWTNVGTLGAMAPGERPLAAWFTAVTPRTVGFNTVDTGALQTPTIMLIMFLMFIGGGSNSTASGIKVSTFMVVLFAIRAFLKGDRRPTAFRRTIALSAVFRGYNLAVLSLLMVMLANFLLIILEPDLKPLDVLFEGFSAFSTTGLSRGITTDLSMASQAILMVLMFVGRIGPLALAFSLARPRPSKIRYTEDDVQVG